MVKTAVLGQAVAVRVERCLGQDIASRVQQFNSPRIPTCVAERKKALVLSSFFLLVRVMVLLFGHTICQNPQRGSLLGSKAIVWVSCFEFKSLPIPSHRFGAALGGKTIRIWRRT